MTHASDYIKDKFLVIVPAKLDIEMWNHYNIFSRNQSNILPNWERNISDFYILEENLNNDLNVLHKGDKSVLTFDTKDDAVQFHKTYGGWIINNEKVIAHSPLNINNVSKNHYLMVVDKLETIMLESRLYAKRFEKRGNDSKVSIFINAKLQYLDLPTEIKEYFIPSECGQKLGLFFNNDFIENFTDFCKDIGIEHPEQKKWDMKSPPIQSSDYIKKQSDKFNGQTLALSF